MLLEGEGECVSDKMYCIVGWNKKEIGNYISEALKNLNVFQEKTTPAHMKIKISFPTIALMGWSMHC